MTKPANGYIRLSVEDRREAVRELAANGKSVREIAGVVGAGRGTVIRDLTGPNGPPTDDAPLTDQGVAETGGPNGPPSPIAATRKAGEDARKAVLEKPADPALAAGLYASDHAALDTGRRVLAELARGRQRAIEVAQARARRNERLVVEELNRDLLAGHPARGRAGRIHRRIIRQASTLDGEHRHSPDGEPSTVSLRTVQRILDTLASAADSVE